MPSLELISTTSVLVWAAIGGVFLLAGVVKGVIGLGLPTLSMALLVLWMAPAEAAAWLIVPSLATNFWQLRPWGTLGPTLRRVGGMQAGIVVGTWVGAWWLGAPTGHAGNRLLGVALLAYAAWGLAGRVWVVPPRHETWLGPLVGGLTGGLTAATGVFVVPAVPYLQSLGLPRDALVQAMGVSFTSATLALAAALAGQGGYGSLGWGSALAMLAPALAGMAAGQWLRQRLSVAVFRRCFFIGLALLGGYMVAR